MPEPFADTELPAQTQHAALDVRDAAELVHAELGPGLPPDVYRLCLAIELREQGLSVEADVPCPVVYRDQRVGVGFRADLVVEDRILVETRARPAITERDRARMRTHLSLAGHELGMVVNVDAPTIEDAIEPVVRRVPSSQP